MNTAVQIADGLGIPLDILANNPNIADMLDITEKLIRSLACYSKLSKKNKKIFSYHIIQCMEVLINEDNTEQSE